ncbi:hypothetical protein C8J57DRAFT_1514764 [Mycena rebaudengoi]|nr:hypothetical protein C8J57DRAFT_1514764 [Mycena rebaudengoi]
MLFFANEDQPPNLTERSEDGRCRFYAITTLDGFSAIAVASANRDRITHFHPNATTTIHHKYDDARRTCDIACRTKHVGCHDSARNHLWRNAQHIKARKRKVAADAKKAAAVRSTAVLEGEKAKKQVKEWSGVQHMDSEANCLLLNPKAKWYVVSGQHIVLIDDNKTPPLSCVVGDTFDEALKQACDSYWTIKGKTWFVIRGVLTQSIEVILSAYVKMGERGDPCRGAISVYGDRSDAEKRLHDLEAQCCQLHDQQ